MPGVTVPAVEARPAATALLMKDSDRGIEVLKMDDGSVVPIHLPVDL